VPTANWSVISHGAQLTIGVYRKKQLERRSLCIKKNGNGVPVRSCPTRTLLTIFAKSIANIDIDSDADTAIDISQYGKL